MMNKSLRGNIINMLDMVLFSCDNVVMMILTTASSYWKPITEISILWFSRTITACNSLKFYRILSLKFFTIYSQQATEILLFLKNWISRTRRTTFFLPQASTRLWWPMHVATSQCTFHFFLPLKSAQFFTHQETRPTIVSQSIHNVLQKFILKSRRLQEDWRLSYI